MTHRTSGIRPAAVIATAVFLGYTTMAEAQLRSRLPAPDLVVTAIQPNSGRLYQGNCNSIAVTVRNQGNADIANKQAFTVRLIVTLGTEIGTTLEDIVIDGGLAAGASRTLTFRGYDALSTGFKSITAFADALGQVAESNETNNTRDHQESLYLGCPTPRTLR